jgi:molybdate/tungstate transport system ATP-binding protein
MTLELTGLQKEFASFTFGPVSTTVESGVTAVLGPSGSGKSTLLSLVAGFETPTAGSVSLDGTCLDDAPPEDRQVGMVFQNYALFPHLSVRENLTFGAAAETDVGAMCDMLEVADLLDRDPGTLSGGEKQRVALARALVSDPDVLLLDEPLGSLDAPIRRRLRLELRDVLSDLGIPVVYVTHDQDEATVVGDRIAVLFGGDLVQEGTVRDVLDNPATPRVAAFLGVENIIQGTVTGSEGETTLVAVGSTHVRTADRTDAIEVSLGIHPSSLGLEPSNATRGRNTFACRVDRVLPQRTDAIAVLSSAELGRLTARVDRQTAEALTAGQERTVSVSPDDVHLIPADGRDDHSRDGPSVRS